MKSRSIYVLDLLAEKRCSYRKSARESLCRGHYIGSNTVIHISVKHSASSVSDLYLVGDKQNILFLGKFRKCGKIILTKRIYSSLALNDLKHDRAALIFSAEPLHVVNIICLGINETACQGLEIGMERILSRCGESGYRSAVEAVFQGYYRGIFLALLISAVLACRLYSALVCLSARVREEYLFHSRSLAKHFCKIGTGLTVIKI